MAAEPRRPRDEPADWTCVPVEGEIFRFHVGSKSRPGRIHLVDLEEEDCKGVCSCESFTFTVGPARRAGKEGECRHITIARRRWYFIIAPQVSRNLQKNDPSHQAEEEDTSNLQVPF